MKDLSKDPHVEIKVKLGRNLFASNLIQEALLSLESTISDAIDYTLKVSLNLNEDIKSLSSDPNYLSIISQLDDPSSISDSELLLINSELQRYSDSGEKLKARNDQNNLYFSDYVQSSDMSMTVSKHRKFYLITYKT